jgi:hypothetical protein
MADRSVVDAYTYQQYLILRLSTKNLLMTLIYGPHDDGQHKFELRKALAQQTEKFGLALAGKVAATLLNYSLGYGHRDYCGMGLEYREGVYRYGELWDGYMMEPLLKWSSKEDFINWLAQQSDASLARLEAKDSFYWGNQTITRQRLKALGGEL